MTVRSVLRRLSRNDSGTALMEFAFILPAMVMVWMGLGDLLYQMYAQSILTGAVQAAGRASGIEGGAATSAQIDTDVVVKMVGSVVDHLQKDCTSTTITQPSWCSVRENYDTFSAVAPEPFTDTNGNGVRDPKECFTDINNNGSWDADPGLSGQGGASDVVLYTMTVRYPRLFPVTKILGFSSVASISSKTILKNQPYATQALTPSPTVCT